MAKVRPFLLALFIVVLASISRAQGFAVQVAAFSSQNEAESFISGLRGRGVEAYWVKTNTPETAYRVRVGGRFNDDQQASSFATKLVGEGVVRAYAIQQYEPTQQSPANKTNNVTNANAPMVLQVDGLAGHALPARAVKPKETAVATVTPAAVTTAASMPVSPATATASAPVPQATPNAGMVAGVNQFSATTAPTPAAAPTPKAHKTPAKVYADEVNLDDLAEFSDSVLESSIQKKDDRLLLYVHNRNARNVFRGTVKLTLQDSGKNSAIEPWQFMLKASEDSTYDLNAKVSQSGSYWVEVLDEHGKTQMIKAASLEPKSAKTEVAVKKPDPLEHSLEVIQPEEDPDAPPKNYPLRVASDNGTGAPPEETKPEANAEGKPADAQSKEAVQAGDVKIFVRKVAESTENVTLEFEIQAPAPLGMISVVMQTMSTTDMKQAIMTTKMGRIPFLVPIADTNGAFNFELKDESGRVLAAGQKSFSEFKKAQ